MRRWAASLAVLAASALVLSASLVFANGPGAVGELSLVKGFAASEGELPEGLAVDRQGNFYVGMAPTREIKKVTLGPRGEVEVSPFANLPPPSPEPGEGGFMTGMATDRHGNLYVALASFNQDHPDTQGDTHGIWRVSSGGSSVELFASLPANGLPNVPAFDRQGNLYVSDSFLGRIWKIDREGNATVWKEDPLLAADPGGPLNLPVGVNGIAFDHNQKHLYAANSLEGKIVRIPMNNDGSAGDVELFAGDEAEEQHLLEGADGIAFDNRRNLYVAVNSQDRVVRVSPNGIAEELVAGDLLQFPASIAFGTGRESKSLYVANFAILNALGIEPEEPAPALLKLPVGVPGKPLP